MWILLSWRFRSEQTDDLLWLHTLNISCELNKYMHLFTIMYHIKVCTSGTGSFLVQQTLIWGNTAPSSGQSWYGKIHSTNALYVRWSGEIWFYVVVINKDQDKSLHQVWNDHAELHNKKNYYKDTLSSTEHQLF